MSEYDTFYVPPTLPSPPPSPPAPATRFQQQDDWDDWDDWNDWNDWNDRNDRSDRSDRRSELRASLCPSGNAPMAHPKSRAECAMRSRSFEEAEATPVGVAFFCAGDAPPPPHALSGPPTPSRASPPIGNLFSRGQGALLSGPAAPTACGRPIILSPCHPRAIWGAPAPIPPGSSGPSVRFCRCMSDPAHLYSLRRYFCSSRPSHGRRSMGAAPVLSRAISGCRGNSSCSKGPGFRGPGFRAPGCAGFGLRIRERPSPRAPFGASLFGFRSGWRAGCRRRYDDRRARSPLRLPFRAPWAAPRARPFTAFGARRSPGVALAACATPARASARVPIRLRRGAALRRSPVQPWRDRRHSSRLMCTRHGFTGNQTF